MSLPKMPGTLAGLAMGAAVAAGGAMPVLGAVGIPVWEVQLDTSSNTYGPTSYVQYKNDNRAFGDNVHLQPGGPRKLQSIVIPMALYSYSTSHEYTATNLRATLYTVDANGIPTTTVIGQVETSNTFTGSNSVANGIPSGASRPAIYNVTEYVTFDFSPLNITLPDNFAFATFDYTPGGDPNLSTWLMAADSVDAFGSTPVNDPTSQWHFLRHNSLATWELTPGPFWAAGWQAVAQINAIPEPASLSLLAAGGLLMLRRRQS